MANDDFEVLGTIQPEEPAEDTEVLGELERPSRSFFQMGFQRLIGADVDDPLQWTRLGTTIAGAVGGSIGGAKAGAGLGAALGTAGGPVAAGAGAMAGGLVGGLGGAVAGAASPELGMELAEELGIVDEGFRERHGLSPADLRTLLEGEAVIEVATGGGVLMARAAGRGITSVATKIGKGGRALARAAAQEHNVQLLPVQVGTRTIARGFVSVMGRFPLVSGIFKRAGGLTEKQIADAYSQLPTRIAPVATIDEVSHDVFMKAKDVVKKFNAQYEARLDSLYRVAEDAGVQVAPESTIGKAEELIKRIGEVTPTTALKKKQSGMRAARSIESVRTFLNTHILPITNVSQKLKRRRTANQSLRQMGGRLRAVDEELATIKKSPTRTIDADAAEDMLIELRQAIQADMRTSLVGASDEAAQFLGSEIKALDEEWTNQVHQLFENSAAKRFGAVSRGGLGRVGLDPTTQPVDALADILLRGESPEMVGDLHRLLGQDSFDKLAASTLNYKIDAALRAAPSGSEGSRVLDLGILERQLGLNNKSGRRFQQVKTLLEKTSGLTMSEVESLFEASRAVQSVEIPNASTFLARRAVIAGAGSIVSGIAVGYGAGGAQGGVAGGLMGFLAFLGGSRLIGHMLTNPDSAKALRFVLKEETNRAVRRGAAMRVARAAMSSMANLSDSPEADVVREHGDMLLRAFRKGLDQGDGNR